MIADPGSPVLFLGFDAAEPELVQQGIQEGWMPGMAALVQEGRCVPLFPMPSHFHNTAWVSTITGTDVGDHQTVLDRQLVHGSYRIVHVRADQLRRPPFWRYLSDAGISSTVVSTYGAPVLESFQGVQVQGWGAVDPYTAKFGESQIDPPEIETMLRETVGDRHFEYAVKPPRSPSQYRRYRDAMLRSVDEQARGISLLMERTEWQFFFGSFAESHQSGHLLWHLGDETHPLHDPDASEDLRDSLRAIYRAIDSSLSRLIEQAPAGCRTFVVNPHGMGPNYVEDPIALILERGGWLTRRSGAGWRGERRQWLKRSAWSIARRVPPARLRIAVKGLLPGDQQTSAMPLADIDWSATRAFALPGEATSYVRVNLAGREPEGIVRPGGDYERLVDELAETIGRLVLADSGLPAVERVVLSAEQFGRPVEGPLPDLCVVWAENGPVRRLSSPKLGTFDVPFADPRTGNHRHVGFMVGAGPGVAPSGSADLTGPPASLIDVAPTALALLGVELPTDLPGRPIAAFSGEPHITSFEPEGPARELEQPDRQ